jgi:hypothetical protein
MLHLFKIHNMFIYYCEYDAQLPMHCDSSLRKRRPQSYNESVLTSQAPTQSRYSGRCGNRSKNAVAVLFLLLKKRMQVCKQEAVNRVWQIQKQTQR